MFSARLSCAGFLIIFGLCLTGCGGAPEGASASAPGGSAADAGSASSAADEEKPRVALIMKSLANEFFLTMEEGARAHQQANADVYELIAQGIKDETDVGRQIQLVEQMVAQAVDAIVIAPADSKALAGALQRARDAGVVVVNIDNKLDAEVLTERGMQIPFVGPDNKKGARAVADHLVKFLEPGSPVAIVEGAPNAFNGFQRKEGFEEALVAGGMRIVSSQTANWEMSQANQVVSGMLTSHPDLKAVLCANDSMALGAVAAIRDAGKSGQVLVVGFDNISAVQELLQTGDVLATADQHGDQLAVFGIEYALEILKGNAPPADKETPVDLVEGTAPASAPAAA